VPYREEPATDWWAALPAGRVTRIDGASPELIALSLEPLPGAAPVVLRYRPSDATSVSQQIAEILDELETAALNLFPVWLPGGDLIPGAQGAGVAAIRALALGLASKSHNFGPFLADLAEAALRRKRLRPGVFAPAVRAAGLARVIASSYGRPYPALLVEVPEGLSPRAERTLVSATEWVAHNGGLGMWLVGAPCRVVDRIETVTIHLPDYLREIADDQSIEEAGPPRHTDRREPPVLRYPAPAGKPHPASKAEKALEAVLAALPWAAGRAWNSDYRSHVLASTFRLDLMWAAERFVVEIDGPEHRGAEKYAADRRRDVQLQLDGYAVLRFTNAQVLDDAQRVASQIGQFIRIRRLAKMEKEQYVER
jgi:very-short-patch-repair endonuclease